MKIIADIDRAGAGVYLLHNSEMPIGISGEHIPPHEWVLVDGPLTFDGRPAVVKNHELLLVPPGRKRRLFAVRWLGGRGPEDFTLTEGAGGSWSRD